MCTTDTVTVTCSIRCDVNNSLSHLYNIGQTATTFTIALDMICIRVRICMRYVCICLQRYDVNTNTI